MTINEYFRIFDERIFIVGVGELDAKSENRGCSKIYLGIYHSERDGED